MSKSKEKKKKKKEKEKNIQREKNWSKKQGSIMNQRGRDQIAGGRDGSRWAS
jgi:hypothetical protein